MKALNGAELKLFMTDNFFELYKEKLNLKAVDVQTTSPLVLAYIGDCVYDLAVREYVVSHYPGPINFINRTKTEFVCAHAQSEIMGYMIGQNYLTDEEMSIYRRGRNQKSVTHSKNSSIQEYRRATGFEALVGFLYVTGQYERLLEFESMGISHLQELKDKYGKIKHSAGSRPVESSSEEEDDIDEDASDI